MTNTYDEKSIESLDPLNFVRLRPGVYAGNTDYSTQLVIEAFSNALDEHNIGHGDVIDIDITDDNIITVRDYAQGFLVNNIREDGKTILEASFSVLNTSGKYRDDGVYGASALGLNGIGGKLITFLSHWTEVYTVCNGEYEHIWFKEGVFEKREVGKASEPSGTKIIFNPSEEFFTDPKPNVKVLEELFDDIASLCPKLTINLNDKQFKHTEGINYLVNKKNGKEIATTSPLVFSGSKGDYSINCGIQYNSGSSSNVVAYVNYGLTDSGPHLTSVKGTITKVLNKWAKENGLLKPKEKNLDGNSLQEGMVLVFNLVSPSISYDAQTKSRIVNSDFVPFLNEIFSERLELWLDNNPEDGKTIIEKAVIARKASEAAKKAREAVKNKVVKQDKAFKLPTTLADCWTKDRTKAELLIGEGKSACSGLVAARSAETQAIYGVRGKMLSVLKTTPSKILANQEINNLIQALGLECDQKTAKLKYNKSKLRYGKIIACADAK
jgi:DNA gyrase subunit B